MKSVAWNKKEAMEEILLWEEDRNSKSHLDILLEAREALEEFGVQVPMGVSNPAAALMIAEAVNHAAKCITPWFYSIKRDVIMAAKALGCEGGWGEDEAYYLYETSVGVASFHDPFEEIKDDSKWPHPWSGIVRQDWAFRILTNDAVRQIFRDATSPGGELSHLTDHEVMKIVNPLCG